MVTPGAGLSGTSPLPLTVQAVNDGAVLLDGELARNPRGTHCHQYLVGGEGPEWAQWPDEYVSVPGEQQQGSRLIGWETAEGQANIRIFTVTGTNTVLEDVAGFGRAPRDFSGLRYRQ